jgi:hypothetical protein
VDPFAIAACAVACGRDEHEVGHVIDADTHTPEYPSLPRTPGRVCLRLRDNAVLSPTGSGTPRTSAARRHRLHPRQAPTTLTHRNHHESMTSNQHVTQSGLQ